MVSEFAQTYADRLAEDRLRKCQAKAVASEKSQPGSSLATTSPDQHQEASAITSDNVQSPVGSQAISNASMEPVSPVVSFGCLLLPGSTKILLFGTSQALLCFCLHLLVS